MPESLTTEIRPILVADVPAVTGLLAQLGYPSGQKAVAHRLESILASATQQVLVAVRPDGGLGGYLMDGYVGVERRLTLHEDEHVEITDLLVDTAARRSGLGRALVSAAEEWASQHALHTVVVRSNVVRTESHPFYEALGYQRMATSHIYRKQV